MFESFAKPRATDYTYVKPGAPLARELSRERCFYTCEYKHEVAKEVRASGRERERGEKRKGAAYPHDDTGHELVRWNFKRISRAATLSS